MFKSNKSSWWRQGRCYLGWIRWKLSWWYWYTAGQINSYYRIFWIWKCFTWNCILWMGNWYSAKNWWQYAIYRWRHNCRRWKLVGFVYYHLYNFIILITYLYIYKALFLFHEFGVMSRICFVHFSEWKYLSNFAKYWYYM